MVCFKSFVLAATAIVCALSVPTPDNAGNASLLSARASTPSSTGVHDGFYYMWSTDGQGSANYTNLPGGQYSVQWKGNGNHYGGKGWNPGSSDRNISYSGSFLPNGNSFLSVYGWTRNPLIEYYIMESYGTYSPVPAGGVRKGTVYCNGANYDIVILTRTNQSSIDGIQTFKAFWSVRNSKRNPSTNLSGTISTACHFDAWKQYGMNLGSDHSYQILATEGYYSSGSSNITVSG